VSISVALQGDSRPEAGWAVPITVKFFAPGADVLDGTAIYHFKLITAKSPAGSTATCEASGVAPGTYDITVRGEYTLTNAKRGVVVSSPGTSVDLGTLLEGDANQDNTVDLDDYAVLSMCWLASKSQAEYNIGADFDRDDLISAADLWLLATNWLRKSPVEVVP
jgi:hypothetical protein